MTSTTATASERWSIPALTGLRFIAAIWVVVFHIRGSLYTEFPWLSSIAPVLNYGSLGVDLFYVLSGFVIALSYTENLGRRWRSSASGRFIWARLARIWPAYAVTLMVAAVWHGALLGSGRDPVPVEDYSAASFVRQLTLVVVWTEPDTDRLTWNGPAWSVSVEWLAYLFFPLLALLLFRLARLASLRVLLVLLVGSLSPLIVLGAAFGHQYAPYFWMIRIASGFLAGALLLLIVRRLRVTMTSRRESTASALALLSIAAFVVGCYVLDATGRAHLTPALMVLVVPLIGGLALGRSHVVRFLASKPLVLGGSISYSVYLVHMLVIEPYWFALSWVPGFVVGTVASKIVLVLLPVLSCLVGWMLWRWVEEPSRRFMLALTKPDQAIGSPGTIQR